MASISALGTGSGLDLNTLLSQLSAAEQTRLTPLTTQQTSYKSKLTAYGVLQSALAKLETASTALKKADTLNSTAVSGSNSHSARQRIVRPVQVRTVLKSPIWPKHNRCYRQMCLALQINWVAVMQHARSRLLNPAKKSR